MKKTIFLLCYLLATTLSSQSEPLPSGLVAAPLPEWVQLLYAPAPDPDLVSKAFRQYYANEPFVKNQHTQYYKRWLRALETYEYQQRAWASSSPAAQSAAVASENSFLQAHQAQQNARSSSNWTNIGPWDWDHEAAGRSYAPGAAHVYTIEQCPNNPNILYAGTATTGIWKSNNQGASWTCLSASLLVNEVYSLEIHPINCEEIYASMRGSIYKSVNGGASWAPTGSAAFQSLIFDEITDLKISPIAPYTLWAATSNGLLRSTDQGANWTTVASGLFQEIEYHPSDPQIMYVVRQTGNRTEFLRSTNGGANWMVQSNGWPTPAAGDENRRAEIAVSPAAPDKVYALLTGSANGGSGLYGVYVSDNAGLSWVFSCCGPQPGGVPAANNINMMGWDDQGLDDGGQYYYDLALAVSPTNANHLFVGGVNLWVSQDGGQTFSCPAKWSHPEKANYVHADIHDINFYPSGDLWVANDGGIFHSTNSGNSFSRRMFGIWGSDFWGFGVGFNNDELMLGGAYHNGTLLKNGNIYENDWLCTDGGDGVGGAVNPILSNQVYSDYNIKTMPASRLVEPSTRPYAEVPGWHYTTGRFSQIEFAADNFNVHYFGKGNALYKTEDDNRTVSLLHTFEHEVTDVEVAWSNDQVIYVATYESYWGAKKVFKSSNGGFNWADITPNNSLFSTQRSAPYDIEVSYEDENLVWLARVRDRIDNNRLVFRSTNGGQSWSDISSSILQGETLTNILVQRGNNDLYIGTTRSVYHSAGGQGDWQLFADGLPAATRSRQLAISYRNGTLLNASNRSVWLSPLANSSPVRPQMSVDKYYSGCLRDTFLFADYSSVGEAANFQWTFPTAAWTSSLTEKTVQVLFASSGQHSASLSVNGQTQNRQDFVLVGEDCDPQAFAGQALQCSGAEGHFISDGELNLRSNTLTLMAWIRPEGMQPAFSGLIFTDAAEAAGLNLRNNNEIGYHWPGGGTHWGWSSGLSVAPDEWSFVAIVFSPSSVTLYVNDQSVVRNIALDPAQWDRLRIGSYRGWGGRNFRGLIDEALLWNRSLSQDEVRTWRHLTKHQQASPNHALFDPSLLAYFQFNEAGRKIYDRVGNHHGYLNGTAALQPSTAPIGNGYSHKIFIAQAGTYDFEQASLSLSFPNGGTYPEEEIVATKLSHPPSLLPDDPLDPGHYWIVNNYGNNSFSPLEAIVFKNISGVSPADASSPSQFVLNKRPSNADTESWNPLEAGALAATTDGQITFGSATQVSSFSQWILSTAIASSVDFIDPSLTQNEQPHWAKVFPNPLPSQGQLVLQANWSGKVHFRLFSPNGQLLRQTVFEGTAFLSLPGLAAGLYHYTLSQEDRVYSGQLIKQ